MADDTFEELKDPGPVSLKELENQDDLEFWIVRVSPEVNQAWRLSLRDYLPTSIDFCLFIMYCGCYTPCLFRNYRDVGISKVMTAYEGCQDPHHIL